MKPGTLIALVIAASALGLSYVERNQIAALQKEGNQMADDIVKLKEEFAKSWRSEQTGDAKSQWPKYHDATGVLKSIAGNRVVVNGDEIPGFMMAMAMSYEIENPKQLEGLKEGDKVKFKLKETENNLTVVEIQKQ
jgi:Cu/Ag efflux protein CusF